MDLFKSITNELTLNGPHKGNRYLILFISVFGFSFLFWNILYTSDILFLSVKPPIPLWYSQHYNNTGPDESFTIKTEGCSIPAMKPFDESVKKFISYPTDLAPCPDTNHSFLLNNKTHIWINNIEMQYYNATDPDLISCNYKPFHRPNKIENVVSTYVDDRVEYGDTITFTSTIQVKDEFVKVTCSYQGKDIFENFFIFAPEKELVLYDNAKAVPKNKSAYNVLVIGIDNVSRLNFYRTMPKTLSYIKGKGAIELLGYNKIADNSFPNIVALLLGYTETELNMICQPYRHVTFDYCPFVWHWFKEAGYYTAFGEDSNYAGTFNYLLNGFMTMPTDYYMHPFIYEAEKSVGANIDWHIRPCMHEKFFFDILLDYIGDLVSAVKSSKLFGFFWEVSLSHEGLNYPMLMDDSYEKFFKRLNASNYLEESIIFLISDHGMRYGSIRATKQGRLEERLPFVYILTPQSFRDNYSQAYNNLKLNSRRLTTPFDMHETLADLINMDDLKNEKILSKMNEPYFRERGISWFLPVPTNRTCKTAQIPDNWCTCHQTSKVKNSEEVMDAANQLVNELNVLLNDHPQCSKLSLFEVVEATEMLAGTPDDSEESSWQEYMVVVKTKPGDGIFEAIMRYDTRNWTVSGTVSRITLYGDQSHCVHNPHLKLYCYCL